MVSMTRNEGREARNPLIVALDVSSREEAIRLCHALRNKIEIFKVGLQLFLACGPGIVHIVHALGGKVFLDLKFFDVPNQVSNACREIVRMGVEMFTLHTLGGFEMMREAATVTRKMAMELEVKAPIILGVTILTSFDQQELQALGTSEKITSQVVHLASLAKDAGLDGVVASPLEISAIRKALGKDIIIVTPGVRPKWTIYDDQKRVLTPVEAMKLGASYIVVGRPIIQSSDPVQAASQILMEIGGMSS